MGAFAKSIAKAKAAYGGNYGKEGKYWVLLNAGKMDTHASKNAEQVVFEGVVVRVVDPGPPPGQRWKPTKGGNENPHAPGEPYTIHYGSWQLGADARCKRFLLVAANMDEKQIPAAVNPVTHQPCQPGQYFDRASGAAVHPGTPGAVCAVDPVENAIELATSPTTNALRDICVEVSGRGITTQGRGPAGAQNIIAVDPVRRVWAKEIHDAWADLHPVVQAELTRNDRLKGMLAREERERAMATAPTNPVGVQAVGGPVVR